MTDSERSLAEQLREILAEQDTFAAAEFLEAQGAPVEIGQRYHAVMRDLYWTHRDLPAVLVAARAGILHCLRASRAEGAERDRLRGLAKTLAYDLASFAWPGWDEPGIQPTAPEESAGFDAARLNLRLAVELGRGPEPVMNAHWVVGAHQLAAGEFGEAILAFGRAAAAGRHAENPAGEKMAAGYAALARLLDRQPEAEAELRACLEALETEKDGPFFSEQIQVARRVFAVRFPRPAA
jgi:hypothetical protein